MSLGQTNHQLPPSRVVGYPQDDLNQLSARSEARSTLLSSIARRQQETQALMRSVDSLTTGMRNDETEASSRGGRAAGQQEPGVIRAGMSRSMNAASRRHIFELADAASEASTRRSSLWTAAAVAAEIESGRSSRMFDRLASHLPSAAASPYDEDVSAPGDDALS